MFNQQTSRPATNNISVMPLILLGCWIVALFFADGFVLYAQADSTNVSILQKVRMTSRTHQEIPTHIMLKNSIYSIETSIATADRQLRKCEQIQATNILIQTSWGPVSNRLDVLKQWKYRDAQAIKLVERLENNPKEIDDKAYCPAYMYSDFVKRLMEDKTKLRERLKDPAKYTIYKYEPFFYVPESVIFTNSQDCMLFVTSNVEEYRERIAPILWEWNDSNSLSILAGMAANDKSEKVRNKAAEAWVALSLPEGLTSDQKAKLLDNYRVPKMKGLTNDQKAWLDNFIASEKVQEPAGKKWAIKAAERMLRKIDKSEGEDVSPAKQ